MWIAPGRSANVTLGVADFHHSTTHNDFAPRFRDQLLSGDSKYTPPVDAPIY
jgi:hypothetical protein